MIALHLPKEMIANMLPVIFPHLDRFVRRFPAEYGLNDCLLGLLSGRLHGFLAWDDERRESHAFAFGSIIDDYDGKRSLRMEMIEGERLGDWQSVMDDEFTRFAKANNCARVRFTGRKGWKAYLKNYRVQYYVFEREV